LSAASQREQRQQLGVVLGEAFFASHPNPKVRASTGYVFLKEMDRATFANSAAQLRGRIESGGGGDSGSRGGGGGDGSAGSV
jgi:hypothetical protein